MSEADRIRQAAAERARALNLSYAGALLPAEAHALMLAGARLVDVRTKAELDWVGRVPESVHVEWNAYPGGALNPAFLDQLGATVQKNEVVMFLCRSGGRSHHAAGVAAQAGYAQAYNVLEGFEGDKDAGQHRNSVGGWRMRGLPWMQS